MPGEGDGCYTEVILDLRDGSTARRVLRGAQRDAIDEQVRERISAERLANAERSDP